MQAEKTHYESQDVFDCLFHFFPWVVISVIEQNLPDSIFFTQRRAYFPHFVPASDHLTLSRFGIFTYQLYIYALKKTRKCHIARKQQIFGANFDGCSDFLLASRLLRWYHRLCYNICEIAVIYDLKHIVELAYVGFFTAPKHFVTKLENEVAQNLQTAYLKLKVLVKWLLSLKPQNATRSHFK